MLLATLVGLLGGCGEDDPNPTDLVLGTWNVTTYDLQINVGTMTLYDYLKNELGLTDSDALEYEEQTRTPYEESVFQKIDFARSGFWTVTDTQGTSRGTWLLSGDATSLVLDKGKPTEVTFAITTLTGGEMVLVKETYSDVEFNDTMKYRLEIKMTKQ